MLILTTYTICTNKVSDVNVLKKERGRLFSLIVIVMNLAFLKLHKGETCLKCYSCKNIKSSRIKLLCQFCLCQHFILFWLVS